MTNEAIYELVLSHFDKSPKRLADALGITAPMVCNWRARGIPSEYAKRIHALSGVSVQDIRPHDWQKWWPELAAGKPVAQSSGAAA